MKKTLKPLRLAAVLLLCLQGSAIAEKAEKPEVTLEGELVDIGCYASREARGPEHQACAARCLKNGNPAGVLLEDGRVYTIAASAPAFTELAAQTVRVTGSLRDQLVRPSALSVWQSGTWRNIPLNAFGAPATPESD